MISSNQISPFEILGIQPTDNKYVISAAYKRMIKMVHPDKIKNSGVKWTKEECNEAFNRIRNAYKTICKNYNFTSVPDYNIEYSMENMNISDVDFRKYKNSEAFNRAFEKQREKDNIRGFGDPHILGGFSEFNPRASKDRSEPKISNKKSKKLKTRKLVKYNTFNESLPNSNNTYEFGLTKIDDYSFQSGCKGGLCGSDISQVFNESNVNMETWESSAMRDPSINNKIKFKTIDQIEYERSNLNLKDLNKYSKKHYNNEKIKQTKHLNEINKIQKQRDEYYNKRQIGN